jgi:hypothetical protein
MLAHDGKAPEYILTDYEFCPRQSSEVLALLPFAMIRQLTEYFQMRPPCDRPHTYRLHSRQSIISIVSTVPGRNTIGLCALISSSVVISS